MASTTVVLITGASRGIGKGLLSTYLLRSNHTVIAGLRDPSSPSSQDLDTLPKGEDSRVILVKIDSSSETDARAAVETLKSEHGISKLDIVVANAGISNYRSAPDAAPTPKFVVLSSGAGSISGVDMLAVENTAYGASKAAVNFVTRRIHYENPNLIAFPINPGWLQTDLGNHAAKGAGMAAAPVPIQDGVNGITEQIDKATRAATSGNFITYSGEQLAW
ncbi:hypothetical protein H2200_013073 [Cladophialophora chaetospira]|uniref:Aflatoxin biosynthesis ketoreductase nor-1 n=1 Tax=Cladophialophora chaetospira TaxID=386627 RepID=A0AA38WWN7_9EURO|nr:hypothetical protein H2200_013073 [Cladophialophora chaetospira]